MNLLKTEKKRILITVKAYPNPSKTYGETVCCAGIDIDSLQWIRLYPIPFRDLDSEQQFKKYSIIEVGCHKATDDKRPESFRIIPGTINIIEMIDTEKGTWERRKSFILQVPIKSMCQAFKDREENDLSLALIKPEEISFEWEKRTTTNQKTRETCYAQLSLFNKKKNAIEKIPFNFYYQFRCEGEDGCKGHKLSIIDWEIGQAYRYWRTKYPDESTRLEKIKEKWIDISNTEKKDVYFYVGNMKRFRDTFIILGVFYPPKGE